MDNKVGLLISLFILSVFIMFSYELVSYQSQCYLSIVETNKIAMHIQKYGYDENIIQSNDYFKKVNVEVSYTDSLTKYHITTIKSYRCDINFFSFSNKDIVTSVYIYSNNI